MSQNQNHRYLIANLLDDIEVGETFERSVLHISVLPWFTLSASENQFIDWFYRHFGHVNSFDAVAAQRAMFGPDKDVPVTILEPQKKFMTLHKIGLSWFGPEGASWAERDPYVGDDYIPHIAQRQGYIIAPNQKIHISSLTLFKASRHDYQMRTVVAKAQFHEEN